mmetsp:Transcript_56165/g.111506  ORF Transcript_56165/g.111506 Transcript_56165/m.111506 type:complete len:244 (-) Transcript_56165:113-844(-)
MPPPQQRMRRGFEASLESSASSQRVPMTHSRLLSSLWSLSSSNMTAFKRMALGPSDDMPSLRLHVLSSRCSLRSRASCLSVCMVLEIPTARGARLTKNVTYASLFVSETICASLDRAVISSPPESLTAASTTLMTSKATGSKLLTVFTVSSCSNLSRSSAVGVSTPLFVVSETICTIFARAAASSAPDSLTAASTTLDTSSDTGSRSSTVFTVSSDMSISRSAAIAVSRSPRSICLQNFALRR